MAGPLVVIMNSGGLRSLVATALMRQERSDVRLSLVHIVDGRDNARARAIHARKQAEHFGPVKLNELPMPHLFAPGHGRSNDGTLLGDLASGQMLLAALEHARFGQAEKLVWPISVNAEVEALASATERAQLVDHFASVSGQPSPRIDTPLAELTDVQVVELGAQLGVPWNLAWSCDRNSDTPCNGCIPCRRRAEAFAKAGAADGAVAA